MEFKLLVLLLLQTTTLTAARPHATIQSEDGDTIDCIDINQQPAFDHPGLKNHQIQLNPSYDVTMDVGETPSSINQIWHKSGTCPKGTIPVRRMQNNNTQKENLLLENHSLAILHADGFAYVGAKGDIRVWNPHVESDDEYSTSRVALKIGPYYSFESLETGWAVNPKVYGDRQTRLFVYWTVDSSNKTGCFDLTCPGFVQTSNQIALGAAIYPISNPTGLPYQITVYIHKDPETSNWWVQYGDSINIGYWPRELFGMLVFHAETAQWGGEVYSTKVGVGHSPHTSTGMGSGRFSDFIAGNSGYVKRMRVLENGMVLRFPQWVNSYTDEYNCYDVYYISDYVEDPEFYYGGPGRNPICP